MSGLVHSASDGFARAVPRRESLRIPRTATRATSGLDNFQADCAHLAGLSRCAAARAAELQGGPCGQDGWGWKRTWLAIGAWEV